MEVIPICTVDKNWVGSSASFSAILAELLPPCARAVNRDFRAVTSAISDIAKIPFKTIKPTRMKISIKFLYAPRIKKKDSDLPSGQVLKKLNEGLIPPSPPKWRGSERLSLQANNQRQ